MEKEKKTLVDWVKNHKRELIIAGVSITAIIAVIIGIENHKALEEAWKSLSRLVAKTPEAILTVQASPVTEDTSVKEIAKISMEITNRAPHYVSEHVRNLPKGRNASIEKISSAAKHGYNLLPGQTWVEAYRTGGLAA